MLFIEIQVGKETLVLRGQHNRFELCRRRGTVSKRSDNQEEWRAFLWFSDLDAAFHGLLKMKLARSDANTLIDLQLEIKNAKEELSGLMAKE